MPDKREFDPIKGMFPNAKEIPCKDCFFRDRTVVIIDGKEKSVGITKAFCSKYPLEVNGKPLGILFNGEKCEEYMKDRYT